MSLYAVSETIVIAGGGVRKGFRGRTVGLGPNHIPPSYGRHMIIDHVPPHRYQILPFLLSLNN